MSPQILNTKTGSFEVESAELVTNAYGDGDVRCIIRIPNDKFNAINQDPSFAEGAVIHALLGGKVAKVELSLVKTIVPRLDKGDYAVVFNFSSATLESREAECFMFFLPNVDLGVCDTVTNYIRDDGASYCHRDTITLNIENSELRLRQLVKYKEGEYLAGKAFQLIEKDSGAQGLRKSENAVLLVPSRGLAFSEAKSIADRICWILQIAQGRRVAWTAVGALPDGGLHMIEVRKVAGALVRHTGSSPIYNYCDGVLKVFLEEAYVRYMQDPVWWQVTADWFVIGLENSGIEVSGMIFSMLLDRVGDFVKDSESTRFYIDEKLGLISRKAKGSQEKDETNKARKELSTRLTGLLQEFAPNWDEERSDSLVRVICEWNNKPSYPKKIEETFSKAGLEEPSKDVTQPRHGLMHVGELKLKALSIGEYNTKLSVTIISLILALLGYQKHFYVSGTGRIEMKDL